MTGGQEPDFPFRLLGMGAEISLMPCPFCDVLFRFEIKALSSLASSSALRRMNHTPASPPPCRLDIIIDLESELFDDS